MPARDFEPTAAPSRDAPPEGYGELLEQLKDRVRTSRVRAARAANTELLRLYWSIGRDILDRQQAAGWGAKVITLLAEDLRATFPDQRGFSRRNLQYMRALAAVWPEEADFVQQAVARLPWGHLTVLLDRLDEPALRHWYAAEAVEHGWSRNVLEHQVMSRLHARSGAAPSNFAAQLPASDSELAQQLTRDPYVFDHLSLTERMSQKALEQALMDRLQQTLTAFGHGMAFVGRQVRFDVGDEVMVLDLLLFHLTQLHFVVVELKIGRFEPGFLGQLGTYVAVVDDTVRDTSLHAPTVGILLCTGRDEAVVRYALASAASPVAVATYETLTPEQRAGLPDPAELTAALTDVLQQGSGEHGQQR
ncbi:PDDEXK nuclease domain-containing protein [Kineococcus arenarius]|uniref:PDDEXK nuclease domain-containing protein n=1 Tax=Kineococcus sp. SYSU DK007 TaxID=3383128 RepID=UPI003D7F06D9